MDNRRRDDDEKLEAVPVLWRNLALNHVRNFWIKIRKEPSCTTILDVLNADCWRNVLDYLSINDIVRSERVSRGWQQVVLGYLPGVKSYRIQHFGLGSSMYGQTVWHIKSRNYRCIDLTWDKKMCQLMIITMGPYIEKLFWNHSNCGAFPPSFGKYCPNIQDITFHQLPILPFDILKKFKRLKKVTIDDCFELTEVYMDGFIHNELIEQERAMAIDLKKLTSLTLSRCQFLKIKGLDQSEDFSRLTELVFNDVSPVIFADVSQLIRKTPNLEILSLNKKLSYEKVSLQEELVAAIGGLRELKRFSMSDIATDALLEAIANGCKKLRYLNVNRSSAVTGRAVRALCRELPRLSELSVGGSQATDEDLEYCISYGRITALDASGCGGVTRALVAAAARDVSRRPRKLLLRLHGTATNTDPNVEVQKEPFGLTLTWKTAEQEEHEELRKYVSIQLNPRYMERPLKAYYSPGPCVAPSWGRQFS